LKQVKIGGFLRVTKRKQNLTKRLSSAFKPSLILVVNKLSSHYYADWDAN
jgi:hypothetical protein